jgi:hypothetical protein
MIVVPHPAYVSLFPRLTIKLKGLHFDTFEVIEAESQAVLNTVTEHYFQDAFQNSRSTGNGTTSMVMVASRPKVSFHQMVAPVQEIMDYSLFNLNLVVSLSYPSHIRH